MDLHNAQNINGEIEHRPSEAGEHKLAANSAENSTTMIAATEERAESAGEVVETITPGGTVILKPDFLERIHNYNPDTPAMYFHDNFLVRWLFWSRFSAITEMIKRHANRKGACLDFGGGAGIFLPTLSKYFDRVTLIDFDPSQARVIQNQLGLPNCEILQQDVLTYRGGPFDCVVAADVLEHFLDADRPIAHIKELITPHTVVITSLPTENFLYVLSRLIFNQAKPHDHYHSAADIERRMRANGFERLGSSSLPSFITPLFSIKAWRLAPGA